MAYSEEVENERARQAFKRGLDEIKAKIGVLVEREVAFPVFHWRGGDGKALCGSPATERMLYREANEFATACSKCSQISARMAVGWGKETH